MSLDNVIFLSPEAAAAATAPVEADDDIAVHFLRQLTADLAALWGFEQPRTVSPSEVLATARLREQRLAKLERDLKQRADQIAELQKTIEIVGERLDAGDVVGAAQALREQNGGGL